ncbi:hypothetical protein FVE85_0271 [Porphyridium purpureum]|uniref:Uncharacterized protein n=1 Tax=Porphyridium purpureum TaxID=35688 RepID=A0A5J4Z0E8_PORPP|nr:hypothetical protein FVE85_0271 [Porphyridium purpureum]|eukprot:POR6186..scf208_2
MARSVDDLLLRVAQKYEGARATAGFSAAQWTFWREQSIESIRRLRSTPSRLELVSLSASAFILRCAAERAGLSRVLSEHDLADRLVLHPPDTSAGDRKHRETRRLVQEIENDFTETTIPSCCCRAIIRLQSFASDTRPDAWRDSALRAGFVACNDASCVNISLMTRWICTNARLAELTKLMPYGSDSQNAPGSFSLALDSDFLDEILTAGLGFEAQQLAGMISLMRGFLSENSKQQIVRAVRDRLKGGEQGKVGQRTDALIVYSLLAADSDEEEDFLSFVFSHVPLALRHDLCTVSSMLVAVLDAAKNLELRMDTPLVRNFLTWIAASSERLVCVPGLEHDAIRSMLEKVGKRLQKHAHRFPDVNYAVEFELRTSTGSPRCIAVWWCHWFLECQSMDRRTLAVSVLDALLQCVSRPHWDGQLVGYAKTIHASALLLERFDSAANLLSDWLSSHPSPEDRGYRKRMLVEDIAMRIFKSNCEKDWDLTSCLFREKRSPIPWPDEGLYERYARLRENESSQVSRMVLGMMASKPESLIAAATAPGTHGFSPDGSESTFRRVVQIRNFSSGQQADLLPTVYSVLCSAFVGDAERLAMLRQLAGSSTNVFFIQVVSCSFRLIGLLLSSSQFPVLRTSWFDAQQLLYTSLEGVYVPDEPEAVYIDIAKRDLWLS